METELESMLKKIVQDFNEKAKDDEKLKSALEGVKKTVVIEIENIKTYSFSIENAQIVNFKDCALEEPDVKIISDEETLKKIIMKELKPFKAYATGKVKIKASLADLLALRRILSGKE